MEQDYTKDIEELESHERDLLRQLQYFDHHVELAAKELKPNHIASYLINLAGSFNTFYEKVPIIKSDKEDFRLYLTKLTANTLKNGLNLLGIEVPDKM